ncbi:bis(5'-nucleosyl)-tetraphosphatase [Cupriavidus necator]|uniref:bis(5'-nucleosyl)-tetraphosphatase n=1 Tax=Cupriavidus necator TaxID=106590 RepID=UPI00339D7F3D
MKTVKRSAGLVVLRPQAGEWRCLILRAYRNWDFPKGLPEPGETPLQAALRETEEETGLTGLQLPWGEDYRETAPYGAAGKIARFYLAVSARGDVALPVSAELGRPEHHEFRWATFDQARQLLPPRLLPMIEWACAVAGTER